jgi:2-beta-glucuronyltransferase
MDEPAIESRPPFLMISAHDFRSKRQANVHFIMREMAHRGPAQFASIGFSPLSLLIEDPRASLWRRSNRVERYNNVECYLWRTLVHPFSLRRLKLAALERPFFRAYERLLPRILRRWITDAGTIILESGISVLLFDLIKKLNPRASVIYLCSDALNTIGCASFLERELSRIASAFDGIRIPSPQLLSEFPSHCPIYFVPHGMDPIQANESSISPYEAGIHLVSLGSMLFDRSFFEIAAVALPDYTFHVIGGGIKAQALSAPNIRLYGEMPFKQTLAYINHAQVGIAPYNGGKVSPYLVDTSMKLMQFEAYGLPAVCPAVAAGNRYGRFSYEPGNRASIVAAIQAALALGRFAPRTPLSWKEVADRILSPKSFAGTTLEGKTPFAPP